MCPLSQLKSIRTALGRQQVMGKPKNHKNRLKKHENHILLVEDETDVAIVTKTRLELEGFKVSTVNDGQEALYFIDQDRPDLMLLDLQMPKLDSFSVYKRLKANELTKDIPVILFSGSSEYMLDLERKYLEHGVDDLISKPYETKILLKKITKLLKQKDCLKQSGICHRQLVKRF